MQLEHYPSRETTIELPSLALLTAPNDQRLIVGMGTVLRKIKGGQVLIGLLTLDQLYLLVGNAVLPLTPGLRISHESDTFIGKLRINVGEINIINTRYWKSRRAIVAALDPVYDQIDDTEQNFCSYLASCYEDPSWRKWVYERYQPASQYRNREEHEERTNSAILISSSNHC